MDNFTIYVDAEGQTLADEIRIGNRPLDLTDSTVKFNMREATSAVLVVDDANATIVDPIKGKVSYDWDEVDVDTPGEYWAWWNVVLPDTSNIETPEFSVIVTQHAPGFRTLTGAIYRRARGIIPISWSALEDSDKYGDALLQERIEIAKLSVFGMSVPVANESTYDIRVQNFVAKVAVVSLIPTAVDYWLDQKISISATGTNENAVWPNRIEALWKIHERLTSEIAADRPLVEDILGTPTSLINATGVPGFSPGIEDGYRTPLPGASFPEYAFPQKGRRLVW